MKIRTTSAVLTGLLLASCSGGERGLVPATNGLSPAASMATFGASRTVREPSAPSAKVRTAKVTFIVRWPKPANAKRRHSRFVSPSTMSAVLQVGSGKNAIVGYANNDGKPSGEIEIEAPVGSDDFTVSLYDQKQSSAKRVEGLLLGQGDVVQTVKANAANRLRVSIDGVVANVGISLSPQSTMAEVEGAEGTQRLTLVGDVPATLVVTPLDVDGNAIVAPGTVPTVKLKASYLSATGLTVAPVAGKKNQFTVAAAGPSINHTFGLVATATDGQGDVVQTNVAVVQSSAIYVAYANGNGAKIAAFDQDGHPLPLSAKAFAGVTQPVGLSYDADDRLLFVADKSGKLLAFDGAGNPSPAFAPHTVPGINSVNYFNAQIVNYPSYEIPNPKRVIVGGSNGITEFDETSGAQLVQAPLPFTPTAVTGQLDNVGYATSGWLVMVGDPAGTVDPYDMVTLAPYSSNVMPTNGEVPSGFAGYLMQQSFGYSGDYCISDNAIALSIAKGSSCLYVVTGSTSGVVRLGNEQFGSPFGQYGVPGSFDQRKKSGTLSAVSVDQLNGQLDVTKSDSDAIVELNLTDVYDYTSASDKFEVVQKKSFATPSSLGYSSPNAIATEW